MLATEPVSTVVEEFLVSEAVELLGVFSLEDPLEGWEVVDTLQAAIPNAMEAARNNASTFFINDLSFSRPLFVGRLLALSLLT